jgi:hypothetical protein
VVLGFRKHGDVPGMQHVKGAKGDADAFAVGLELFDVIEDHSLYAGLGKSNSKM